MLSTFWFQLPNLRLYNWVFTTVGLNYMCASFMVVNLRASLDAWGSVYWIPHFIMVAMIVVGQTLTPKKKRSSAKGGSDDKKAQ